MIPLLLLRRLAGVRTGARSSTLCLLPFLILLAGAGCSAVPVHEQRLVSRPGMLFSRSALWSYDARTLSEIQPGRQASGGSQASTCTLCR